MNYSKPHILDENFYGISPKYILSMLTDVGSLAVSMRDKGLESQIKSNITDIVTNADIAVQEEITKKLKILIPQIQIYGEESIESELGENLKAGTWVIIDPIDGTSAFKMGRKEWCISIAILVDGESKLGFIHAPDRDETYFAIRNIGAFEVKNNIPYELKKLNRVYSLSGAHVLAGALIHLDTLSEREEIAFNNLKKHKVQTLRLGSGALEVTYVATGKFHVFFETNKPWDIAAARVIAREVGCEFFCYEPENQTYKSFPEELNSAGFCVCHPGLSESMKEIFFKDT